jgi:hypothetical protein
MPQLKVTPAINRIQSLRYVKLIHAVMLQEPTSSRANTAMCMARSAVNLSQPIHLLSFVCDKKIFVKVYLRVCESVLLEPMMHEEPSEL